MYCIYIYIYICINIAMCTYIYRQNLTLYKVCPFGHRAPFSKNVVVWYMFSTECCRMVHGKTSKPSLYPNGDIHCSNATLFLSTAISNISYIPYISFRLQVYGSSPLHMTSIRSRPCCISTALTVKGFVVNRIQI